MGAAGGAACTAIRLGFRGLQWCFTGQSGMPPDAAASLSLSWRVFIPTIGGLLGWLVLWMYRRGGREQHAVDYVEAVRITGGDIPLMATAVRTLSSAFSVATGAAIGREGSMIQFATAICSQIGKFRIGKSQRNQSQAGPTLSGKWPPFRSSFAALTDNASPLDGSIRSRAVAFGVAAGVAAAYQAPIAGAFFASEIAIGATRPRELPPLLLASVTGWLVSRPLLGPGPLFPAPAIVGSPTLQWLWLVVAAAALGLLAPLYQWLIRQSLRAAHRLPVSFAWAGALVGGLSLATPLVWGNGDRALFTLTHVPSQVDGIGTHGLSLGIVWVAGILAARLLATCFCVGAGVAGGVFTPTVFAGAAAGLLIAMLLHVHLPLLFVLAGISSLLAAVTHAPLMTSCMTAELTGKWALFPLFYLTSWIAWQTAARLSGKSLYAIATNTPGDGAHDQRT
jgi:CIC family chloride channel protein